MNLHDNNRTDYRKSGPKRYCLHIHRTHRRIVVVATTCRTSKDLFERIHIFVELKINCKQRFCCFCCALWCSSEMQNGELISIASLCIKIFVACQWVLDDEIESNANVNSACYGQWVTRLLPWRDVRKCRAPSFQLLSMWVRYPLCRS